MIDSFLNFLTYENIYYIANIGVIPCWFFLIILPNHIITNFLVKSVIIPLLLSTAYIFISYQIFNRYWCIILTYKMIEYKDNTLNR